MKRPFDAIVTEPDGKSARIVDLAFVTMGPDEWDGCVGDLEVFCRQIAGKYPHDAPSPEHRLFLAHTILEHAASLVAFLENRDGKI